MDLLLIGIKCKRISFLLKLKHTTVSAHEIRILKRFNTENLVEPIEMVVKKSLWSTQSRNECELDRGRQYCALSVSLDH